MLALVWRPTRPAALDVALPVVDVAFAVALGLASGGVFSLLFLVFLFAPATTAFQLRPRLTLAVTVLSVGAYLVHALAHPSSSRSGAVDVAFARALYLSWIGAVSRPVHAVARRERRLADLLQSRKRLVQETLHADERARARLAGDLHDGVLQSVLAVRYAVEEAAEQRPGAAVLGLRPHRHRGRDARRDRRAAPARARARRPRGRARRDRAARGRAGRRRSRSTCTSRAADTDRGGRDAELFRSALELVGNAVSHAEAAVVDVTFRRGPEWDELALVSDDGKGFDPAVLGDRLREGHIGLLALQERIEGVGGTVTVDPAPESGSTITVRVPATAAGSAATGSSSAADRPFRLIVVFEPSARTTRERDPVAGRSAPMAVCTSRAGSRPACRRRP